MEHSNEGIVLVSRTLGHNRKWSCRTNYCSKSHPTTISRIEGKSQEG